MSGRERPKSVMMGKNAFASMRVTKASPLREEILYQVNNNVDTHKGSMAPVVVGGQQWKEFTAQNGRKYFYNPITKETRWALPTEEDTEQSIFKASAKIFAFDPTVKSWVPTHENSEKAVINLLKKRESYRIVGMAKDSKCVINININGYFKFTRSSNQAINIQSKNSIYGITIENEEASSKLGNFLQEAIENVKKAKQKAIDSFKNNATITPDTTKSENSSSNLPPPILALGATAPISAIKIQPAEMNPDQLELKQQTLLLQQTIDSLMNKVQTLEAENLNYSRQISHFQGKNLESLSNSALVTLQQDLLKSLMNVSQQISHNSQTEISELQTKLSNLSKKDDKK